MVLMESETLKLSGRYSCLLLGQRRMLVCTVTYTFMVGLRYKQACEQRPLMLVWGLMESETPKLSVRYSCLFLGRRRLVGAYGDLHAHGY